MFAISDFVAATERGMACAMNVALAASALLCLLTVPVTAWADDERLDVPKFDNTSYFFLAGGGVAEGEGRLGIELDALVAFTDSGNGFLPALGVRYVRGLTGPLDLRLSLVTLGVYNDLDAGVGFALLNTPNIGLGLRAGLTGNVIVTGEGGGGVFAGTPGVVFTVRSEAVALSVGADVPMYFNGFVVTPSESASGAGFVFSLRPNAALEIGSGSGAKFYARGDATIFIVDGRSVALAHFALGVHF